MCLDERRGMLYSLNMHWTEEVDGKHVFHDGRINARPLKENKPRTAQLGNRPYNIVVGPEEHLLYVSDWAGRRVLAIDPEELRVVAKIPVGEHPNQMILHPKDGRLFVACASSNSVH